MKRAAIKAAGGAAYEALLAKERAARSLFRQRHPNKVRLGWKKCQQGQWGLPLIYAPKPRDHHVKRNLYTQAHRRARARGMTFTVAFNEIVWPTHCPVLGMELDYSPRGGRRANNPANPSLDRWDNTKGYVSGNVFVISLRANALKSNATAAELDAVARYAAGHLLRLVA